MEPIICKPVRAFPIPMFFYYVSLFVFGFIALFSSIIVVSSRESGVYGYWFVVFGWSPVLLLLWLKHRFKIVAISINETDLVIRHPFVKQSFGRKLLTQIRWVPRYQGAGRSLGSYQFLSADGSCLGFVSSNLFSRQQIIDMASQLQIPYSE